MKELSVFDKHQLNIARKTLKMSDVGAMIMGGSGKLMVVNDTGEIFGIKAYGVIHRGKKYGTLDTINEYYWGEYHPVKK